MLELLNDLVVWAVGHLKALLENPFLWKATFWLAVLYAPTFILVSYTRELALLLDVALYTKYPTIPKVLVDLIRRFTIRIAAALITVGIGFLVWPEELVPGDMSRGSLLFMLSIACPFVWDGLMYLLAAVKWLWRNVVIKALNLALANRGAAPVEAPAEEPAEDESSGKTIIGQFVQQQIEKSGAADKVKQEK